MSKKMPAVFTSLIMIVSLISTGFISIANANANGFGGYNWSKTGVSDRTTSVNNSSEELVVSHY